MPNPLAYIGQGLGALGRGVSRLPARLMPHPGLDSVASDMGGYSGQGALYDDTAPADTDDPGAPGQYSSPLPPMSSPVASGSQVSGGTLPPRSGPISYGEFDTPTNRAIQSAANPPPLPHRASGVRGFFGTLASMSPVTSPFANQIAYGSKGMEQLRNRQDYESNLPHQIKAADLYNTQERTRAMDQDRDEVARQRQQTFDMNRANIEADNHRADQQELGRFEDKGGKLLYDQQSDLTMPSSASTPSVLPSRQSLDSTWQGPEQPSMEDLPLRGTPSPSSLPRPVTLPAAAQMEPGYQREPSAPYDPKGSVRSRPTPTQSRKESLQAAQDVAQAGWIATPATIRSVWSEPKIDPKLAVDLIKEVNEPDKPPTSAFAAAYRAQKAAMGREPTTDEIVKIQRSVERPNQTVMVGNMASDPAIETMARLFMADPGHPPTRNPALLQRVMDRVAQIGKDEGTDVKDMLAAGAQKSADTKSLGSLQQQTDQITAFENTANANLDRFLKIAPKMVDTGSPFLNKTFRGAQRTIMGNSDQAAADVARVAAYNEISKVLSGSMRNAVSDSARGEAAALLAGDYTVSQLEQAARILKADMAQRKGDLDKQLKEIRGRMSGGNGSGGGNKLTPAQAQDYLRKVGWTGGSPTPAQKSAAEAAAKADGREF